MLPISAIGPDCLWKSYLYTFEIICHTESKYGNVYLNLVPPPPPPLAAESAKRVSNAEWKGPQITNKISNAE